MRTMIMVHLVVQVEVVVVKMVVAQGVQEQQGRDMLAGQDQPPMDTLRLVEVEVQMRLGEMQDTLLALGVMEVTENQTILPDQP